MISNLPGPGRKESFVLCLCSEIVRTILLVAALVSIIIPVFNQLSYTKACLEALSRDREVQETAEIIVVNDGSTDDTAEFLSQASREVANLRFITMPKNSGFACACNRGAHESSAPELLFLNNDTLPEAGWLSTLQKTLQLARTGLVGPKLLYPESRNINHAGYVYGSNMGGFYSIYHHFPEEFHGVQKRREFQALLGACILLRREHFNLVSGFSEYGLEDIDLCFKLRSKGLRAIYEPQAVVLHYGSVTLKGSQAGSYVITDVIGFSERWPKDKIEPDDETFYSEDGFAISEIKQGTLLLKEVITEAAVLYAQAMGYKESGALDQAIEFFQKAVACYRGYSSAYEELVNVFMDQGNLQRAVYWAEQMTRHAKVGSESALFVARLHLYIHNTDRAKHILEELVTDWTISEKVVQEAQVLLGGI